jgi:hypothetical protein
LGERYVDREGEMFGDVFGGDEDCTEEFAGEQAVKAGGFGERDELIGGDEAASLMLPAGESLEAAEEAGAKFDKWLEIRDDLIIFEPSSEIVRVADSHGRDDTTALRSYTVKFRFFQRKTRSRAAAGQ